MPTSKSEGRKKEEGLSHPEEDREGNSQAVKKIERKIMHFQIPDALLHQQGKHSIRNKQM